MCSYKFKLQASHVVFKLSTNSVFSMLTEIWIRQVDWLNLVKVTFLCLSLASNLRNSFLNVGEVTRELIFMWMIDWNSKNYSFVTGMNVSLSIVWRDWCVELLNLYSWLWWLYLIRRCRCKFSCRLKANFSWLLKFAICSRFSLLYCKCWSAGIKMKQIGWISTGME